MTAKRQDNLDWLGEHIVDSFRERFPDNIHYIQSKVERLRGVRRFQVLLYCNNLDDETLAILARRVNVNPQELRFVTQWLRQL